MKTFFLLLLLSFNAFAVGHLEQVLESRSSEDPNMVQKIFIVKNPDNDSIEAMKVKYYQLDKSQAPKREPVNSLTELKKGVALVTKGPLKIVEMQVDKTFNPTEGGQLSILFKENVLSPKCEKSSATMEIKRVDNDWKVYLVEEKTYVRSADTFDIRQDHKEINKLVFNVASSGKGIAGVTGKLENTKK